MEREAVEIINAATSSNIKVAEGKESVDVCIAIQGMMEDSRIEGAITFAEELGVSREEVKQSLMAKYEKSEEEAEELMKTYWKS